VIADNQVGAGVDRHVGDLDRVVGREAGRRLRDGDVLPPPVERDDHQVHLAGGPADRRHHLRAVDGLADAVERQEAEAQAPHVPRLDMTRRDECHGEEDRRQAHGRPHHPIIETV